jgi:formylglycine-generating enzyme required for sulfatase activity
MTDIFISYASGDRPRIIPLVKALEAQGWSVWWDRIIPPGKTFAKVIEEAVEGARCVVVVWTATSVESEWVSNEASEGARRKVLIPALMDAVEIPFEFRRIQAADIVGWDATPDHPGFRQLVEAIAALIGPPPGRAAADAPRTRAEGTQGPAEVQRADFDAAPLPQGADRGAPRRGAAAGKRFGIALAILVSAGGAWLLWQRAVDHGRSPAESRPAPSQAMVAESEPRRESPPAAAAPEPLARESSPPAPSAADAPAPVAESPPSPAPEADRKPDAAAAPAEPAKTPAAHTEARPQAPEAAPPPKLRTPDPPKPAAPAAAKPRPDAARPEKPAPDPKAVAPAPAPPPALAVKPRDESPPGRMTNRAGMELVRIPAAAAPFTMGSRLDEAELIRRFGGSPAAYRAEKPARSVRIGRAFYLQATPVTQGQWRRVMGANPASFQACGDDCPVEAVSWNDARQFIARLNQLEGETRYRLPSEAEWEYAARAGSEAEFFFGDDAARLGEFAWFAGNSGNRTHPVGRKQPNAWGLFDMAGNVWEWVEDDWHPGFDGAPTDGSAWVDAQRGASRVVRGGAWGVAARFCRSAARYYENPAAGKSYVGLRVAMSVK